MAMQTLGTGDITAPQEILRRAEMDDIRRQIRDSGGELIVGETKENFVEAIQSGRMPDVFYNPERRSLSFRCECVGSSIMLASAFIPSLIWPISQAQGGYIHLDHAIALMLSEKHM